MYFVCMNYLAHAYLSFNEPSLLLGNMISDFVKGKKKFDYPISIQHGIALHRAIDNFTDKHPATKEAAAFFKPTYRLYAGAFVDVVYDHFLANDQNVFTPDTLLLFTQKTYEILEKQQQYMPAFFQSMFPYMKTQNWLYNYQYKWGIEKSFGSVVRRAAYLTESGIAFELFQQHYHALNQCYNVFFPELKEMCLQEWDRLQKT
jgi:acyl carrier protein phosphodiesterase